MLLLHNYSFSLLIDSGRETVTTNQFKIAIIAEMIHTASLVHDDVIDEADIRRGSPTVNSLWGNKMVMMKFFTAFYTFFFFAKKMHYRSVMSVCLSE